MTSPRTVQDVIDGLQSPGTPLIPPPPYVPLTDSLHDRKIFLAAMSMRHHTTDEGWQLTKALEHGGFRLTGKGTQVNHTDVPTIVSSTCPGVLVVQDQREWEGLTAGKRGYSDESYTNIRYLQRRNDIFKLTVLKDAQQKPEYHSQSAEDMSCHAWIVYYHPDIVTHVAPYVRRRHLVRTYHSIEPDHVPPYSSEGRKGCIISGAIARHSYPLRTLLFRKAKALPQTYAHPHPGYRASGSHTPGYLKLLSKFKISIATSSKYGYALRKIVEATACGCRVITDLPVDDVMPHIDSNLIRVPRGCTWKPVAEMIPRLLESYNPEFQEHMVKEAIKYYDWRACGERLANDIENLRGSYE